MNRKKELCRNFQRGSCQYGDRCKFLHSTLEQSRPGAFGFGIQSTSPFLDTSNQPQKPNLFGFGVQQTSHSTGARPPGGQNQSLFANKWTRSSTVTAKPSKQGNGQTQTGHECTDAESCRRQIIEDFENERPLWKLTCYAHNRGKPCDIPGDVSYEELRAVAYEDARKGLSLQSIIERERNLVNAKLREFEKLRQKPELSAATNSSLSQSGAAPSAFSFGQRLTSSDTSPMMNRLVLPSQGSNVFSQTSSFMVQNQSSGVLGMKSETSGVTFGSEHQNANKSIFLSDKFKDVQTASATVATQQLASGLPLESKQEISAKDCAIWLKAEWEVGEIPEEEPPAQFCF